MNELQSISEKKYSDAGASPIVKKKAPFSHLNDKIIFKIFSYLTKIDLGRVARVCKKFNNNKNNPVLWLKMNYAARINFLEFSILSSKGVNRTSSVIQRNNCLIMPNEYQIILKKNIPEIKLSKYLSKLLATYFPNNCYLTYPCQTSVPKKLNFSRYICKIDKKIEQTILLYENFTNEQLLRGIQKIEMNVKEIKVLNSNKSLTFERWGWSVVNCTEAVYGIINVKMKSILLKVNTSDENYRLSDFFNTALSKFPNQHYVAYPYFGVYCYMFKDRGSIKMCYSKPKRIHSMSEAKMIMKIQNEYTKIQLYNFHTAKKIIYPSKLKIWF